MENHQKTARAHRALSFLYALVAILGLLAIIFRGVSKSTGHLIALLVVFGGLFALHHFTANAAKEKKPWARTVSIVIGVLLLPGFPVGTIIGVSLLSYAWKPWDTHI